MVFFRHSWVLVRKTRPDVIVIEGLKKPSVSQSSVHNAKYCSLFFRPWTLLAGTMRVPNISLLGLNLENLQAVYDASFDDRKVLKVRKTCRVQTAKTDTAAASIQPPSVLEHINWHAAWSEHLRGNVVSQAASGLIKSFLLHTLAASGAVHGDHESGSDGHESEPDPDVPPLHLREDHLQQLITPPAPEDFEPPDASETGLTTSKKFQRASQKTMRTLGYSR